MLNKLLIIIAVLGPVIALTGYEALNRYARAEWPFAVASAHNQTQTVDGCMYPVRPLANGQCDNTDPACPETIKEDGGQCHESVKVETKKLELVGKEALLGK